MKRFTICTTTAAAVLMVTAGVASAQQSLMKAEVPFAFSVGNKVMDPGTIHVRRQGPVFIVDNHSTKHSSTLCWRSRLAMCLRLGRQAERPGWLSIAAPGPAVWFGFGTVATMLTT